MNNIARSRQSNHFLRDSRSQLWLLFFFLLFSLTYLDLKEMSSTGLDEIVIEMHFELDVKAFLKYLDLFVQFA